jgi:simple sugar transport system ATP-binding protein
MSTPLLELRNLTKTYHGVPAVKNVSFDLRECEVHSLVGENGAGKSTLTRMIAGVVEPTEGEILLEGNRVVFGSPAEALKHGIAMVFQETSLVPSLTVAQNLYLGEEKMFNRLRGLYIAAQQFLQSLNLPVDPTVDVSSLGAAQNRWWKLHARCITAPASSFSTNPQPPSRPRRRATFLL